jgi:hypothetical protein
MMGLSHEEARVVFMDVGFLRDISGYAGSKSSVQVLERG